MSTPIIECVPNISEGRDRAVIQAVADQVETVEGVMLLDVDPGAATNRTVITLAGPPEGVLEAAVRLARKATELIDMRRHSGEHPRFGALDVCPLVPVGGITMDQTAALARRLGQRLADEVGLTIYFYEHAATSPQRRNLADVRAGEYENLARRLASPDWKPDCGPAVFNARSGATAVGARDFLVAYNINLNTTSTRRANAIAFDLREKGRPLREGNPLTGKISRDAQGNELWTPGSLKAVKAIGWFIEEYGVAQLSMNLTDLSITPLHVAFDQACEKAAARGVRVTGSELVGLLPMRAMLDAGRYFLCKQQRSAGVSDAELIKIAVKSLGLDDLYPFKPEEKIIELALARRSGPQKRLIDLSVERFVHEAASESPAPGGGSVAAVLGALGAALATMVANLSAHKRGWDDRWEEFSAAAEEGKRSHDEMLRLVDEDTRAFNKLMDAFGLPQGDEAQKAARKETIQAATRGALEVPLELMRVALASMDLMQRMAQNGMESSVSDAGVAAIAARAAINSAFLNVRINARTLHDKAFVTHALGEGQQIEREALRRETEILRIVGEKIGG